MKTFTIINPDESIESYSNVLQIKLTIVNRTISPDCYSNPTNDDHNNTNMITDTSMNMVPSQCSLYIDGEVG